MAPVRLSEQGELVIPPLAAESVPAEADVLQDALMELLPRPPPALMLIEMDNRIGFTDALVHAGGKTARPNWSATSTPARSPRPPTWVWPRWPRHPVSRMRAWTAESHLREDTVRAANSMIVNHHHRLAMSGVLSAGTMSSSDGQRFPTMGYRHRWPPA